MKYTSLINSNNVGGKLISNNTDFNVMFSNNVIEYDTKSEQIQTVIGGNNVRYENNSISINANLEYFYLENYSGTFSQNEVTLNGNILGGIIGAYVQIGKMTILDNTFNINSSFTNVIALSYGELTDNINISSNKFNINNDENWSENGKRFILLNNITLGGKKVNISNNKIETNSNKYIQYLILMQNVKDTTVQKVYIEDNEIDVFKKINFNNNNVQHIVVVNGKEFTENTDLK